MKKCKYHKYNNDTYENSCTLFEVVCNGDKSRQKNCVVAQLLNECEKYENALDEIAEIASGKYEELDPLAKQQILDIIKKAKDGINEI